MDELDTAGVHFRSATEPFDTSSAAGRLFVQILGAFAEFEREVIIDRVISGMERKAAKGEWTPGPRPCGYAISPKTQRFQPHPEEAEVVREIFTLYAGTGLGTRVIADRLNAQGKRTKSGGLFAGHTVFRMLGNCLYLGEVGFRNVVATDAHEPLDFCCPPTWRSLDRRTGRPSNLDGIRALRQTVLSLPCHASARVAVGGFGAYQAPVNRSDERCMTRSVFAGLFPLPYHVDRESVTGRSFVRSSLARATSMVSASVNA